MAIDFNIEPKVDDPQRLLELNGVPVQFYLSAEEINTIFKVLAALLGKETSLYKGDFGSLEELEAKHPLPEPGSEAQIRVVDGDNLKASWDNTDKRWFLDGIWIEPGSDAAYLLKSLYDPDGNGVIQKAKDIFAALSAGANKYYGTNAAGVTGMHALPSGGGGGSSEVQTYVTYWSLNWQGNYKYQPLFRWVYNGVADSDSREITLAAADATYDRFDTFGINLTSGQIEVKKGIPSENPQDPEYDPLTFLPVARIRVTKGSTAPEGVTEQYIYNEGAAGEWAISVVDPTKWDLASTNGNPPSGTYCIETLEALQQSESIEFTAVSDQPMGPLSYEIKNITGGAHRWLIRGKKSNGQYTSVFIEGPSNYSATATTWQRLSIEIPSNPMVAITSVLLLPAVPGVKYYLDKVRLVNGTEGGGSVSEVTKDYVDQGDADTLAAAKAYADQIAGSDSGSSVKARYADITALLAARAGQLDKGIYYVADASGDATVDAGGAYYEYLGTSAGTLGDYRKLSEEESQDVTQPTASEIKTALEGIDAYTLTAEEKATALAGGGGSSTGKTDYGLTGAVDGVNTVFQTSAPFAAGKVKIWLNGIRQYLGDDYTESTTQIIEFIEAPHVGDKIIADY